VAIEPKAWPPLLDTDDLPKKKLHCTSNVDSPDQLCYIDFSVSTTGMLTGAKVRFARMSLYSVMCWCCSNRLFARPSQSNSTVFLVRGPLLLAYSDTVGWAMQPVEIVSEMTYYVSGATLNLTHSLTSCLPFSKHLTATATSDDLRTRHHTCFKGSRLSYSISIQS